MPLASTVPPAPPTEPSPRVRRPSDRRAGALPLFALALLLVGLTGCASGSATESERGEARDATRGARIADLQATSVVKQYRLPTATFVPVPSSARGPTTVLELLPTPTPTPRSANSSGASTASGELVLASFVDPSGNVPLQSVGRFDQTTPEIHVLVRFADARPGDRASVVISANGSDVARRDFDATYARGDWVDATIALAELWGDGFYTARLLVNNNVVQSRDFTVALNTRGAAQAGPPTPTPSANGAYAGQGDDEVPIVPADQGP